MDNPPKVITDLVNIANGNPDLVPIDTEQQDREGEFNIRAEQIRTSLETAQYLSTRVEGVVTRLGEIFHPKAKSGSNPSSRSTRHIPFSAAAGAVRGSALRRRGERPRVHSDGKYIDLSTTQFDMHVSKLFDLGEINPDDPHGDTNAFVRFFYEQEMTPTLTTKRGRAISNTPNNIIKFGAIINFGPADLSLDTDISTIESVAEFNIDLLVLRHGESFQDALNRIMCEDPEVIVNRYMQGRETDLDDSWITIQKIPVLDKDNELIATNPSVPIDPNDSTTFVTRDKPVHHHHRSPSLNTRAYRESAEGTATTLRRADAIIARETDQIDRINELVDLVI